jgi:hypothetical protein
MLWEDQAVRGSRILVAYAGPVRARAGLSLAAGSSIEASDRPRSLIQGLAQGARPSWPGLFAFWPALERVLALSILVLSWLFSEIGTFS